MNKSKDLELYTTLISFGALIAIYLAEYRFVSDKFDYTFNIAFALITLLVIFFRAGKNPFMTIIAAIVLGLMPLISAWSFPCVVVTQRSCEWGGIGIIFSEVFIFLLVFIVTAMFGYLRKKE